MTPNSKSRGMRFNLSNRRWRVVLVALSLGMVTLLLIKALTGAGITPSQSLSPDAIADPQVYTPLVMKNYSVTPQLLPFSLAGIQIVNYLPDPPRDQSDAWRARELGTRWLRDYIDWGAIQPNVEGEYDWSLHDTKFAYMAEDGTNVIAILGNNPSWAAEYPGGPVTETVHLTAFLADAVERYDGDGIDDAPGHPRVQYWELYNEPDLEDEGHAGSPGVGFWGNNGAGYAQMLHTVYPAIKGADPTAQVVFGGVAYEDVGLFDLDFVDQVMTYIGENPGDYFDLMNFHSYPNFASVWAPWGVDIMGKATRIREIMAAHGISKPMICTEAGDWSSPDWSWRTVSHETQSRYVVQLYVRSMATHLDTAIWYQLIDCRGDTCPWKEKRGLLDADLNRKPSYSAYRTLATRLAGAGYERTLTAGELNSDKGEGYLLVVPGALKRTYVVWTTQEDATATLRIPASEAVVYDKYDPSISTVPPVTPFEPYTVRDGDDGSADGRVSISYGPSPIYVEVSL